MKPQLKLMLGFLIVGLLAIAGESAYLYNKRHTDDTVKTTEPATDPDDLVFLRQERPRTLDDVKALKGKPVWVHAAGQLDYFPYKAGHVDFAKNVGKLGMIEKLLVVDAVEQKVPANVPTLVPQGSKQVELIVTLPNQAATAGQEFAVPVGDVEADGDLSLLNDQVFYYDDPHKLYSEWSPAVWQAIDQHKAIPGMTERQAQMAYGQLSENVAGDTIGDRTVKYFNLGHPVTVVFVNGEATKITQG